MREIVSPLSGIRSPFGGRVDPYKVLGFRPALVADMSRDYFRSTSRQTFDDLFTHSRLGNATMVDSDGLLKWAPHNLALNSATPATQSITVVSGADYTVECTGSGSVTLSGAGSGTVTEGNPVEITASTTSLTLTVAGSVDLMWCYRSDLGGMAPVPADARVAGSETYVPTTSTARYLPRRHNHVYSGGAWVDAGTLVEPARTQLLHTTNALVTQNVTTTAQAYTLHFTGTGTVTLSGAYSGSLAGTGTGEENRVSLTFTSTAATLTLTVTGTVTDAQLEAGATPTSYIPNLAGSGTATRAADTSGLTIDSSIVPWPTPKVIGDELVTNGDFATGDITGWTEGSNITGTVSDGILSITRSGAISATAAFEQVLTVEAGKVYQFNIDVVEDNGAAFGLFDGSTTALPGLGPQVFGSTGSFDFVFVAPDTTIQLNLWTGDGTTSRFDNISVKEINPLAVCIQVEGDMTYADDGTQDTVRFLTWQADASNYIRQRIDTNSTNTGALFTLQNNAGTLDLVSQVAGQYSPGINVPFNIASRHGSTFVNGAVDGTALTADLTPVALPDLSGTDLQIGYDFMGNIKTVRIWTVDIGDTGIAEATS